MPASSDFLFRAGQYLRHLSKAKGAESIHSPFVFEFYNEVLCFPYEFSIYEDFEIVRRRLLQDQTIIDFMEFGAGKSVKKKSVSAIARTSLMPHRKAAFLFRLCRWLKPLNVIELGTSLGLTTSYLATSAPGMVYSFEAVGALCQKAELLWKELSFQNIQLIAGPIEKTLPEFLQKQENVVCDLAVVDANHRYLPSLENFDLLNQSRNGRSTCIVFDDIYWSAEMAKAWREISNHPDVDVSLDLFDFGVVFFRPESSRQQFTLRW